MGLLKEQLGVRTDFLILRQMLQYELHSAERYRRFVSLVMIGPANNGGGLKGLRDFLGSHGRSSDVMAEFDNSVAVLMGETDRSGALTAISRYKDMFNAQMDLRFAVVTFPADGGKADKLIQQGYQRLNKARRGNSGAVIYSG